MGKAGRVACIFTPYALTVAALVCIILVGLGCTSKDSSTLNNFYFFRADLKNFTSTAGSQASQFLADAGINLPNTELASLLHKAQQEVGLKDFYSVGLWSYCDGNITNNNMYLTTMCSKPQSEFWFNPIQVWRLGNTTTILDKLPTQLRDALKVYKDVSIWMFIAYIVAFVTTAAELIVGIFAVCSRWGSFMTSLVATVAFLFTAAASITASALFGTLTGTFNSTFKQYGITAEMGHQMYVTTWLAVALSLGAMIFWFLSSCCCSGRSSHHRGIPDKAPYTYESLGPQHDQRGLAPAPYGKNEYLPPQNSENNISMRNMTPTAYEPYRHHV